MASKEIRQTVKRLRFSDSPVESHGGRVRAGERQLVGRISSPPSPRWAMAAYTTYKVSAASVNLKRRKKSSDPLVKLLRMISFIDALVSVLTLQNTLIAVNSESGGREMLTLSAVTSAIIMAAILAVSVITLIYSVRTLRRER